MQPRAPSSSARRSCGERPASSFKYDLRLGASSKALSSGLCGLRIPLMPPYFALRILSRGALAHRPNLKNFTNENRRATARRRGRSTPSASPEFHEYCETVSSGDLPPPSQRLQLRYPKPTASEIAADYPEWAKRVNENLPLIPPYVPPFILQKFEPEEANEHGSTGQISSPRQAPASVSMADDAISKASSHSGPAGGIIPDLVNNPPPMQYDWGYVPPHQPVPPTTRPTIPRQQPPIDSPANPDPRFPANFPTYHCTQNMNEIAAYLANASYVAALGGPPLADLKYGIIIVPAGEESLLFGPSPDFAIGQDFVDAIDDANRDYDRALRMHDPDKDSEEFVRHRFDDDFPSVSAGPQQNVEATLAKNDGEGERGVQDDDATEDAEEPQPKRPRRGPRPTSSTPPLDGISGSQKGATPKVRAGRSVKRAAAPATDTPKPQGVAKTRRSTRVADKVAKSPPQSAVKRTLRGKK
ncbi:hypothetical protein C8A01DRAFT_49694 [Parachaetomium inaequale]|uniref:Uncharacterized protein n=1 Tax=Parachaetomium inaequale TaxID=2588326 RepID=A0AAN6SME5_9PEZI|nr:hypothetical protein C8A01DRAFT_49694 [Parachaetomium inaequale]